MAAKTAQRLVWWVLTVTVAGIIYWFSDQTAEQSGTLSGEVTQGLLGHLFTWLHLTSEQLETVHEWVRSGAHVFLFWLLGLFCSLLVRSYTLRRWVGITVLSCGIYAVLDECHQQWFAEGRAFEWVDIAKDVFGILLGTMVVLLAVWYRAKRRKKGN